MPCELPTAVGPVLHAATLDHGSPRTSARHQHVSTRGSELPFHGDDMQLRQLMDLAGFSTCVEAISSFEALGG